MDLPVETIEVGTPKRKPLRSLAGELEDSVRKLCRHPRYGATLGKAKAYIVKKLQEYGYEVQLQEFFNPHGQFYNIIAERQGTAPGRYVIGAHYDVCVPEEDDDDDDDVWPGADDNGSAVAVLLAVAKRLPKRPRRTVEMVFYACEEPPFFQEGDSMGSWHHANSCDPDEVMGMIALDMLGLYGDEAVTSDAWWAKALKPLLPGHGNFLTVCGAADDDTVNLAKTAQHFLSDYMCAVRVNLPKVGIPNTPIGTGHLFDSDHRNYHPLGIPAIMITDTAEIRNPNYHCTTDTPDTLDYTMMARATWAVLDILKYVAW